ncbi:MAG: class II aldolase/adducin family protein [Clostridia bacterium]|nr:class II aldolase/adducin family protein [Clostridia bacterium]
MEETALRQSVIDACLELTDIGFVYGTWGNISVRWEDGMIITPSRISYEQLKPEDLVYVSIDGRTVRGYNTASSEKEIHRLIYAARPEINAIVHCHSAYATAAAAIGDAIPPITEEMCQLIGGEIPATSRFVPSSHHKELGLEASKSIGDKNALLLRNHGPVCCGRDLAEAMITCRVTEKAAKIYVVTTRKEPAPIAPEWVADGRDYFLNRYGKEN